MREKLGSLLSTHDINPLLPVMDRVVYLAAGRAVSGRTEEVVRSDVLSALTATTLTCSMRMGEFLCPSARSREKRLRGRDCATM